MRVFYSLLLLLVLAQTSNANEIALSRDEAIQVLLNQVLVLKEEQENLKQEVHQMKNKKSTFVVDVWKANVRNKPYIGSKISNILQIGTIVEGRVIGDWLMMDGDKYISLNVLSFMQLDNKKTLKITKEINVRSMPILGNNIIRKAKIGEFIKVYKRVFNKNWYLTTKGNFVHKINLKKL